jgi:hypothetical protein
VNQALWLQPDVPLPRGPRATAFHSRAAPRIAFHTHTALRHRARPGAFTPPSAAGGIGPCLSTGEPGAAAATNAPFSGYPAPPRSTPASPRASRSTLTRPRAIAFHTHAALRHRARPGAFTPQSAAGGIGPCLSTGEPGAAAATRRSTPAWPSRHRVPLPRCPRATAFQHSRRGWNQRSNSPSPRATAFHSRSGCATVCQQFSTLQPAIQFPVADRVPMVTDPTLDSAAGHVRAFVDAADVRIECGRGGRRRNGKPGCSRDENVGTRWREGHAGVERLVAAAAPGSPVLKHGPMPPAADGGVNAPLIL